MTRNLREALAMLNGSSSAVVAAFIVAMMRDRDVECGKRTLTRAVIEEFGIDPDLDGFVSSAVRVLVVCGVLSIGDDGCLSLSKP